MENESIDRKGNRVNKQRRALIVGINKYPGAMLQGCVNDANDVKYRLLKHHDFKDSDIRMLLDGDATMRNWIDGLEWLASSPPKAIVLHWNSSHGTQIKTSDPGETDHLSEAACPQDFDWSPERMITDKQFVSIFSKMPGDCVFNWCSDSCHSGNLSRALLAKGVSRFKTPRAYPVPDKLAKEHSALRLLGVRAVYQGLLTVGFVSACRSDQSAYDTVENNRPCGAFTHFFLESLHHGHAKSKLYKVGEDTTHRLLAHGYDQIPCVAGTRRKERFLS